MLEYSVPYMIYLVCDVRVTRRFTDSIAIYANNIAFEGMSMIRNMSSKRALRILKKATALFGLYDDIVPYRSMYSFVILVKIIFVIYI